jgi:uncharacterized protein
MIMIAASFRFLFIILVLYLIFIVVRFFQSIGKAISPPPNRKSIQGTMVKDECCNTYIPKEEAIRETRNGTEYFFCSKTCRNAFLEKKETSSEPGQ